MGSGNTSRTKGHAAERLYAKLFRELGFPDCETSRYASTKLDNAKVDLIEIPFNVQIKAGKQTNMNPGKELLLMDTCVKAMFSAENSIQNKPKLLIHRKEVGRGGKRLPQHDIVYMSLLQFDLFKNKSKALEYECLKTFRFETSSPFKTIVGITFEVFVNEIIKKHYTNGTSN